MKKILALSLIIIAAGVFSGCVGGSGGAVNTTGVKTEMGGNPPAEQKVGDTTKTGLITQAGDKFFITVTGQTPQELDSYSVSLSDYVGQTVTVTGQYSGNTLFVGSVE